MRIKHCFSFNNRVIRERNEQSSQKNNWISTNHGRVNQAWHSSNSSRWTTLISDRTDEISFFRFIDFDHEVRFSTEHLSEADKKLVVDAKDPATSQEEPKKKKFKVEWTSAKVSWWLRSFSRDKIVNIWKSTLDRRRTPTIIIYASSRYGVVQTNVLIKRAVDTLMISLAILLVDPSIFILVVTCSTRMADVSTVFFAVSVNHMWIQSQVRIWSIQRINNPIWNHWTNILRCWNIYYDERNTITRYLIS